MCLLPHTYTYTLTRFAALYCTVLLFIFARARAPAPARSLRPLFVAPLMKTVESSPSHALALKLMAAESSSSLPVTPSPPCSFARKNRSESLLASTLLGSLSDDDGDDDDGVDVVTRMLDSAPSTRAPIMSQIDTDRLLATWQLDLCQARTRYVVEKQPQYTAPKPCAVEERNVQETQWCFGEDCTVADVFTRVRPDRQKQELERRLPGRRWSDAVNRFRSICGQVVDNCDGEEKKRKAFWRRGNHTETKLRIQCPIKKTLAKFR